MTHQAAASSPRILNEDEYAVAAALGSPLPAPSFSYVYLVTVYQDYSTILYQGAASCLAQAERLAAEYIILHMPLLFRYKFWLPISCSLCGAEIGAPHNLDGFAATYRLFYERENPSLLVSTADTPQSSSTHFSMRCSTYNKHTWRTPFTLDLSAESSRYLYSYPTIENMVRNISGDIIITKTTVDKVDGEVTVKQ